MPPNSFTAIVVIGGIALLIGLFGGGVEVNQIKLPRLPVWQRVLSALVGVVLMLLGLVLDPSVRNPLVGTASTSTLTPVAATSEAEHSTPTSVDIVQEPEVPRPLVTLTVVESSTSSIDQLFTLAETNTPIAPASARFTPTNVPPTNTPIPTATSTSSPTNTRLPTATSTDTPVPPNTLMSFEADTPPTVPTETSVSMATNTPSPTLSLVSTPCNFVNELVSKGQVTQILQGGNGVAGVQVGLSSAVDVPIGWTVHNNGQEYQGPIHFEAGTFASFWAPDLCQPLDIPSIQPNDSTNICTFIDELVKKGEIAQILQGGKGVAGVQIRLNEKVDVPTGWTVHNQGVTYPGPVHFDAGTFASFWAPSWCEPLMIP